MQPVFSNPLIVQSDHTVLLETAAPAAEEARNAIRPFAELIKSPEYMHTWRITALSLWNAAAAGHTPDGVMEVLDGFAKYPVPEVVRTAVFDKMGRYGRLRLVADGKWLRLEADDALLLAEVSALKPLTDLLGPKLDDCSFRIAPKKRGELKQVLASAGHPVQDLVGYTDGDPLAMTLVPPEEGGLALRDYQVRAVDAFLGEHTGNADVGSGVVVLPCGAGKTVVGIASMVKLGMRTLIMCTGGVALAQWRDHILRYTSLTEDQVGEYSSAKKELRQVTLTTYQLLTWRKDKGSPPVHFRVFHEASWGLIVYDEVHLLPAPIFRETAYLQARRRLGLTATLVREDGRETDVFALVGPKRFDLPWRLLEEQGWIATAKCVEVRVSLSDADRLRYAGAANRDKHKLAATNAKKGPVVEELIKRHTGEQMLVLGTYVEQLGWASRQFGFPIITGATPKKERAKLVGQFRSGEIEVLGLSRVGNFAMDLPSASVAIQISGTFGSRQEEAQRLGRVLRPGANENKATFYTVVTRDTKEQEFAERRQLFLAEQGYPYAVEDA